MPSSEERAQLLGTLRRRSRCTTCPMYGYMLRAQSTPDSVQDRAMLAAWWADVARIRYGSAYRFESKTRHAT